MEMIAALAVLLGFLTALAGFFPALVRDVPQTCKVIQSHARLQVMLCQIRRDVDRAVALHQEADPNNPPRLVIEQPAGVVSYQQEGPVFQRRFEQAPRPALVKGTAARTGDASSARRQNQVAGLSAWSLPHANITWDIRQLNGTGQTLVVHTSFDYQARGRQRQEQRLANTHMYFVGGTGHWKK